MTCNYVKLVTIYQTDQGISHIFYTYHINTDDMHFRSIKFTRLGIMSSNNNISVSKNLCRFQKFISWVGGYWLAGSERKICPSFSAEECFDKIIEVLYRQRERERHTSLMPMTRDHMTWGNIYNTIQYKTNKNVQQQPIGK